MSTYFELLAIITLFGIWWGAISGLLTLRRTFLDFEDTAPEGEIVISDEALAQVMQDWMLRLDFDLLGHERTQRWHWVIEYSFLGLRFIARPHFVGLYIVVLYLAVAVGAVDPNQGLLDAANANQAAVLGFATAFTAAVRTAVANSIGMTPHKNWEILAALVANRNTTSMRAVYIAMILAHYTANVTKWGKAIQAMEGAAVGNWVGPIAELKDLKDNILVWQQVQAHPAGKFLAQRLLTSNPSWAAMAFRQAKDSNARTLQEFCRMKYAPAIDFAADMDSPLLDEAKWVAANILHKPFKQEFFDTVKKSSYWLYTVTAGNPAPTATRFGTGPVSRADFGRWLGQQVV